VRYDRDHVCRLLHRFGWSWQQPAPRARERGEAAIKRWVMQTWPGLKKKAQILKATLVFLYEGGFSLLPMPCKTWAPRGQTPFLYHCFNWPKLSAISAVTPNPRAYLRLARGTVASPQVFGFVRHLLRWIPGTIFLFWDGLNPHRSKKTRAALRHRKFFSLAELNQAIRELLTKLNQRPFRKRPGCRASLFHELDRPALGPLPRERYEFHQWAAARVNIDYHVEFDRHYYSVPYTLTGQRVEIRATLTTVEIFHRGERVASRRRSRQAYQATTVTEHGSKSNQRRLAFRKGAASAKVAVARKLAIRLYIMLRDKIDYAEFCRRRGSHAGMLGDVALV